MPRDDASLTPRLRTGGLCTAKEIMPSQDTILVGLSAVLSVINFAAMICVFDVSDKNYVDPPYEGVHFCFRPRL